MFIKYLFLSSLTNYHNKQNSWDADLNIFMQTLKTLFKICCATNLLTTVSTIISYKL